MVICPHRNHKWTFKHSRIFNIKEKLVLYFTSIYTVHLRHMLFHFLCVFNDILWAQERNRMIEISVDSLGKFTKINLPVRF